MTKPFFLVDELTAKFRNNKIHYDWIAQDPDAKRSFEWEADTVKISTVQSAKGMDSPIVIIIGAETFIEEKEYADNHYDEIKLMYVAMTRAREMLIILHSGNGGLVPQLMACENEYSNYREAIITLEG